jgi:putative SOS response-associated peptidase YedK
MCGRFVSRDQAAIERYFNVSSRQYKLLDRYNVVPGTDIPVIRLIGGERVLSPMRWGLIPCWAKDGKIGHKMINAIAETVATNPAFCSSYKSRRCLIPADGFYEWRSDIEPVQPYYIHRRDGAPIGFAGLWETRNVEDEIVETCAIVTTESNDMMAQLHDRMPVILAPENFDRWVAGPTEEVGTLLVSCPYEWLKAYPISAQVDDPRNEGPELLRPAA